MKITVFIFSLVLGLSACQWATETKKDEHDIFTDTITYRYKTIHERAADCGGKPDSTCTVVNIKYPVFSNQANLNDTVKKKLLSLFTIDNKPDTGLQAMARSFIKAYANFKETDPRSPIYYTLNSYVKIVLQDSSLISLEYGGYNFQGGAHGASFTGFINWDVKAGKQVKLDDIFKAGYRTQLSKIAEGIFRKDEKLSDTASLKPDYFFKDDRFALNENYSITPAGIKFLYNQYEIKPYAAGQTALFIPYTQIRTLLRPKSVAGQYIKENAGI